MLNKEECIYANEDFGVRVCKLECMPVTLEKCKNCKERGTTNAKIKKRDYRK